jgi:hypothetical protein
VIGGVPAGPTNRRRRKKKKERKKKKNDTNVRDARHKENVVAKYFSRRLPSFSCQHSF